MFPRSHTRVLLTACLLFTASGCNTPDAVSKYCAASTATLDTAKPIFQDIKASCLRQLDLQKGIGQFATVTEKEKSSCDDLGKQGDAAIAAAQILSDYFTAINAIATFGVAKTSTDASTLVKQTSVAVGASSAAQKALGSMTNLLTNMALNGYRQRALAEDLPAVRDNVGAVTDALAKMVQRNYIDLELKPEENLVTDYDKRFARAHATEGEVVLQMDTRWRNDEQAIAARRDAAQCLIRGLNTIKKGMTDLAAHASSLKAKEIPALLDPYITQLQTLIPQIQKAF